ncbi:MAG: hypothetical protein ABR878_08145 [Roseiarcus sp.]|jgi:uncharacterized protein (DUF952 family)
MTLIFRIVGGEEWRAAAAAGVFAGSVVDRAGARGPALRREPSRGGASLSVLHGPLALDAVVWTRPLPLGKAGRLLFGSLAA